MSDKLLKQLYRQAMAVCHPDRAPAHLHSFMEKKAKELNAAYETGSLARVRKIAEELGVKDIPPMPKPKSAPKQPKANPQHSRKWQAEPRTKEEQADIDRELWCECNDDDGDLQKVKRLLAEGANPDSMPQLPGLGGWAVSWLNRRCGWTSLILAADKGHAKIVKALAVAGANLNAKNNVGWTALHAAIMKDPAAVEVVKVLLAAGANPNLTEDGGGTPLMMAATFGDTEIVKMLLAADANPNVVANIGKTALDAAKETGRSEIVRILEEMRAK